MMLGIMAVMDQKDYCTFYWQWHVQGLVCWPFHLAMCSLAWLAGPDARHPGRYEPEGPVRAHRCSLSWRRSFFPRSSLFFGPSCFPCCTRTRCSCPCPAGLAGFTSCTSSSWTSCRARVVAFRQEQFLDKVMVFYRCCGPDSAYRLEVPQLHFFNKVVFTPLVAQSLSPIVLQTKEILLLYI